MFHQGGGNFNTGGGFHPGGGGGFNTGGGGGFNTGGGGGFNKGPRDILQTNQELPSGEGLKAANYHYYANMQDDGNFVLLASSHFHSKNAIWASKSHGKGKGPYRLVMQSDGNLVIYDSNNKATWATGTDKKGAPGHKLIMQDDGNLVIYDGHNKPTWSSETHRT